MYDDALLIQLLYSLSLDPEKLSMLIQSNFSKDEFLCYQNYKSGEKSKIFLDDCLIWFMLISSTLMESLVLTLIFTKKSRNGEVASRIFLTKYWCKVIYSRFKGRFGGRLT